MNILIVDDERKLTETLAVILRRNNFEVDTAFDGEDGLCKATANAYDAIVLDIMLPLMNGFEVLKELRAEKISVPVLMLSAKSQTSDKISALNCGADDYLTKPFSSEELVARIKALTRRKGEIMEDVLTFGDLSLDKNSIELICGNNRINLGKKEYQILEMLITTPKKVIEKERIIEKIWGYDADAEYNTVEVYVSFLRRKISAIHSTTQIKSQRNLGYVLVKGDDK